MGIATNDVFPHCIDKMALLRMKKHKKAGETNAAHDVVSVQIQMKGCGDHCFIKSVRPGGGLIFSENTNGEFKVDQARGRQFYRKFQPWLTKSKLNKNPHKNMEEED